MPKVAENFDTAALLAEVHKADVGILVSTNNEQNFKQTLYKAARRLGLAVHIYRHPRLEGKLMLLKKEPVGTEVGDAC